MFNSEPKVLVLSYCTEPIYLVLYYVQNPKFWFYTTEPIVCSSHTVQNPQFWFYNTEPIVCSSHTEPMNFFPIIQSTQFCSYHAEPIDFFQSYRAHSFVPIIQTRAYSFVHIIQSPVVLEIRMCQRIGILPPYCSSVGRKVIFADQDPSVQYSSFAPALSADQHYSRIPLLLYILRKIS